MSSNMSSVPDHKMESSSSISSSCSLLT